MYQVYCNVPRLQTDGEHHRDADETSGEISERAAGFSQGNSFLIPHIIRVSIDTIFVMMSKIAGFFNFFFFFLVCFQAERKRYEKETEKYYTSLEKLLNMSAKKKEPQLQEVRSICEMIL